MHLGVALGLHVEDLVADALPDIALAAAADGDQAQAQRVAQAPALIQHPRQPARQPVLMPEHPNLAHNAPVLWHMMPKHPASTRNALGASIMTWPLCSISGCCLATVTMSAALIILGKHAHPMNREHAASNVPFGHGDNVRCPHCHRWADSPVSHERAAHAQDAVLWAAACGILHLTCM